MIYRVLLDGADIYGTSEDSLLISPAVKIELNNAGSLEFTMPPFHKNYLSPKLLTSDVEVYEGDELIWYGRVLEINTAMNKNKQIYCEGPLAYFNDSIQRPEILNPTTYHTFFQKLIDNHNSQVPENRRFAVGEITVDDDEIYRELNYEKTKDAIENMCLKTAGGYLFFRKEDGVNYVDWLSDLPYVGTQDIKFGLNLVDISQYIKAGDVYTAIIPLGKEDSNGVKLTITDVNEGNDFLESEAVDSYGRISTIVEFSEIATADELLAAAQRWLSDNQFDPITINCDAAELHYLDPANQMFRVGQKIRVTSTPHLIDKVFPLTSISINLDSAVKKISVGTQRKQELSEITNSSSSSVSYNASSGGGGGGGGGSDISIRTEIALIEASKWEGESAPYTQTVTTPAIRETDSPIIAPIYDDDMTIALSQKTDWAKITKAKTTEGHVIFECFDTKPTTDMFALISSLGISNSSLPSITLPYSNPLNIITEVRSFGDVGTKIIASNGSSVSRGTDNSIITTTAGYLSVDTGQADQPITIYFVGKVNNTSTISNSSRIITFLNKNSSGYAPGCWIRDKGNVWTTVYSMDKDTGIPAYNLFVFVMTLSTSPSKLATYYVHSDTKSYTTSNTYNGSGQYCYISGTPLYISALTGGDVQYPCALDIKYVGIVRGVDSADAIDKNITFLKNKYLL